MFRVNSSSHDYLHSLTNKQPSPGTAIRINRCAIFQDTIKQRSWSKSPAKVDVAVVYPIDSLGNRDGDDCVHDLMRRADKVIAITWTDNKSFDWMNQFNPVRVTFDAAEERPDYQERMEEHLKETEDMDFERPKVPSYASNCPTNLLMKFFCRRCSSGRWGRLNKPNPGHTKIKNAQAGEFTVKCLKCGTEANDNYNWYDY